MNNIGTNRITGLVLAGGRGSRMGGVDKGLQLLGDVPMAAHVIRRLAPQAASLAINANRNLEEYGRFGLPVWPDDLPGFEGPLAGMQTGLARCPTEYLLTAPCDSPFLPPDLAARLGEALAAQEADLAVAVTGEGAARQAHPVFCLLKAALLPGLTAYLESGGRKIDAWYKSLKTAEVRFEDEDAFRNINTIEELNRCART